MKIVEYFEADLASRGILIQALRQCGWEAGNFLLRLLEEQKFSKTLGGPGKLFFLLDGENVVSFLTLTGQDCIALPDFTPWIGFVFTFPAYRGHRYAGLLLDHARKCAETHGFPFVFLATDHTGLYEQYGFSYWGNLPDIHGEDSLIYTAPAADITIAAEAVQQRACEIIRRSGVREAWESYYAKVPPAKDGEELALVIDPMLATGGSACDAVFQLKKLGYKRIKFLNLISAPEGIAKFEAEHPDVPVYTAAKDERLNSHFYIVPGLGDAGDRIFGTL